jgi:uncharacterized protein (DUF885 family)
VKKLIPLVCLCLLMYACKKDGEGSLDMSAKDNDAFAAYETHFLDALWKLDPDWATGVGYHKYDSVLVIPNSSSRQAMITFTKVQMDSLAKYNPGVLSESNKIDYKLIQNRLDATQWSIQQEKAYEWNPGEYNVIGTFAKILNENYAPLTKRVRSFYQKMANIPAYYKEAQKQIKNPVPELTTLAIEQMSGGVSVIEKDFADSLKKTGIPAAEQKQMLARAQSSAEIIKNFAAWLKDLKNEHGRSFRLGKELYEAKFKYNIQSAGTAQQLYNAAVERKKDLHGYMAKICVKLWPKYFGKQSIPKDSLQMIAKMIDTLSVKHVKPDEFQSAIEKEIPQLVSFIKSKNLLTLDDGKPLVIRKEPAYMAGVAGASVSSPGPYDKNGNTYYNVGSLAGWVPERAESYLREYNQYILQILCIHEAIPGHYTQLVYANKSPSLIKSVLGNGAMIEGWAVFTEQMMLENGFGNNEPEMWLMWYKWNLRSICNTILDYSVHTGTMDKDACVKFLTREAFQQQAEAEGKWRRVSVSSVQLTSYYSGYKEIVDLRDAYRKKLGDKYTVKDFNEKFLSYGSAPVKYIKESMLGVKPDEKGAK